ncbi:MAG: gamma-glutamyl-gamma-aminobutyrate hydrolase family protein [Bacteroidales bacterium]|jgi:putative glutamine amidotransferase|nr:gamma-glutamyl-gamma-aminobutyrate hydrolase family protein [Bacteroidales bacterium]
MIQQNKKKIGIIGYRSEDGSVFGAGSNYLELISRFGKPYIIFPDDELAEIDLLILPGGLDIAPQSFGEYPTFKTGNQDVFKQFFFEKHLPRYIDNNVPIFGICLGFQMLAVYFGSKMEQHLWRHPQSVGRSVAAHIVEPLPHAGGFATHSFDVNSHHHQGVLLTGLSSELEPLAVAQLDPYSDEMLVEAFRHRTKPIMAVQWHPEEWMDNFTCNVIEYLLKSE